jgi:hypothetical protein
MKTLPFSLRVVIQFAIVTTLPCLPLFFLVMPLDKIIELLAKVVS